MQGLTVEEQAEWRERMQGLSSEVRDELREQLRSMTPQERRQWFLEQRG